MSKNVENHVENVEKRKQDLLSLLGADSAEDLIKADRLVDELVFLEERMTELRQFPFMLVDPKNPSRQKATPAARQYKEFLQQYNNSLRLLFRLSGDIGGDQAEESPLRAWVKARKG